ncbi:MAG: AraC family transcriptional regulator, partial [bacterium]
MTAAYLSKPATPGSKEIHLLNTNRPDRLAGRGWCIIQPEFPALKEEVYFTENKGYLLLNTTGIKNPHPEYSSIIFPYLSGWDDVDPSRNITLKKPIHGAFSLKIQGDRSGHSYISRALPDGNFWIRFYARFPEEVLERIKAKDYLAFLEFIAGDRHNPLRLGICRKHKKAEYSLCIGRKNSWDRAENVETRLIPDQDYCIEVHCITDSLLCRNLVIYLGGDSIINYLIPNPEDFGKINRVSFGYHRYSVGYILFDDIIFSENRMGPVSDISDNVSSLKDSAAWKYEKIQIQYTSECQWIKNVYNRVFVCSEFSGMHDWISMAGAANAKGWYRVRTKDTERCWSPWTQAKSLSQIKLIESDSVRLPTLSTKQRAIKEVKIINPVTDGCVINIVPGEWYTLIVDLDLKGNWISNGSLQINFHSSGAPISIDNEEAGIFNPENNYYIELQYDTRKVGNAQTVNDDYTTKVLDGQLKYVDGTSESYIIDTLSQKIKVNFRVLPQACLGPWLMECQTINITGNQVYRYPVFFHWFFVGSFIQKPQSCVRFYMISGSFIIIFVCFIIFIFKRRKKQLRDLNRKNKTKIFHPAVEKIIDYLHNNFREKIKIEDLSSLTGLSKNHVSALFKKETDENISDYVSM